MAVVRRVVAAAVARVMPRISRSRTVPIGEVRPPVSGGGRASPVRRELSRLMATTCGMTMVTGWSKLLRSAQSFVVAVSLE